MKPGRTGVKGVIADRDEAASISREQKAQEMEEMRKQFEKSDLGGKTYLEEQRALPQGARVDPLVQRERERRSDFETGRFGHLREVGVENFLTAVEAEESDVWIVLHLYDSVRSRPLSSLPCQNSMPFHSRLIGVIRWTTS